MALADKQAISEKYLEKILQTLSTSSTQKFRSVRDDLHLPHYGASKGLFNYAYLSRYTQ